MGSTFKKIIQSLTFFAALATFEANASPEFDRVYQLDSVAWLKSSDNLDEIFSEFLDQHYTQYFQSHPRFEVKKISSLNSILTQKDVPYETLVQDPVILKKISQKFQVESLIRTHVYKEGSTYRFVMEWVFTPKNTVLAKHEFRYADPGKETGLKGSDLPQALDKALDLLIAKLPFLGKVTGVDNEVVTVNMGRIQNIEPRQVLEIYTLDGVKIHPKLKTIEDWKWIPVGKIEVQQVEDSLCFGKVIQLEPGKGILRHQKIKVVLPAPAVTKTADETPSEDLPRLGWVATNLSLGFYSREVGTGTGGRGGSGISELFDVDSLIWLNSRFLTQASFSGSLLKLSPTDLATSTETGTSYSGTGTQVRLALGYTLTPTRTIFDPTGWIHFGYRSTNYNLTTSSTDLTGGSSLNSLFIGVGGEIPFRKTTTFQFGMDVGLIKTPTNIKPNFGSALSSTDLMFNFGATYQLNQNFHARVLLKINSQSMDFSNGKTISQKLLSIGPSILYYF